MDENLSDGRKARPCIFLQIHFIDGVHPARGLFAA
jgi:hypothetical protein